MDAFLRELRERVHIGVVGGSDYAKIAEQLGEGDEGERGGRGLPGVTCALNPTPRLPLEWLAVRRRELLLGSLPHVWRAGRDAQIHVAGSSVSFVRATSEL